MLNENFFAAVSGPPISANTAVAKDVGIYSYQLNPTYGLKSTFKKSSAPRNCLAVNDTHIYTAQKDKSHIHVYSRERGSQEALVPFRERITSLALADDVLVLGTAGGRLILWETCTGRQITTPPCHVQQIECIGIAPHHVLTGSEDSNIHVWATARLLDVDAQEDQEPECVLSHHRGPVVSICVGKSENPETTICITASRDKTCIVWNYRTGDALRTLLFPTSPLCAAIDACGRSLVVATEDNSVYLVELFGEKPLIGAQSEHMSSAVHIKSPLGIAEPDAGPAACIALSYDGATILTGHAKGKILQWSLANHSFPTELADLNATVTNLVFTPALLTEKPTKALTVVKPTQAGRDYTFTSKIETRIGAPSRFDMAIGSRGFSVDELQAMVDSPETDHSQQSAAVDSKADQETDTLWAIVNEQRTLQSQTFLRYLEARQQLNGRADQQEGNI